MVNQELFQMRLFRQPLHELNLDATDRFPAVASESLFGARPWFEDPEWINELSEGLGFKEMFWYKL